MIKKSAVRSFKSQDSWIGASDQADGAHLSRMYRFKYLGHYVTDDLEDQADIERKHKALAIRSNMLICRFVQ